MLYSLKEKLQFLYFRIFPTITRVTLNRKIKFVIRKETWGDVLEIGAQTGNYKRYMNFKNYAVLDIKGDPKRIDYLDDLHHTTLPDNSFDTVVMIEVLEHLYNPFLAAKKIHSICREGGTVIATTRFVFPYHGAPYDYFRFTLYGLKEIFGMFREVKILTHGNMFLIIWELMTSYKLLIPLRILNPVICILLDFGINRENPLGFIIVARK
jgi:SAM-dependent methyltransferase